ncbi:hypothetical protein C8P68_105340 [Mucilaginibacter yixingensis]|uniref:PepSY-like beta-lactamase-inhibitor n=1 Tax=Mucilaginibacter yixingensis TaxID=1295612 RepID=A0A2T5J8Q1_9SPHI|nr:hypothetical protein [Mucilaginibacter yixingensis]PTQ95830.1 hypothetical protein C8P68_105340 [Mucilaginibacter yixingensis]
MSKPILILFLVVLFSGRTYALADADDSVTVRVYNASRHYIKKYTISIDTKEYTFTDIEKHNHSDYRKVPYLWPFNTADATIIRKRFLQSDTRMQLIQMAIDHVGEQKITHGAYTIIINTKFKKGKLLINTAIKPEQDN